MTGTLAVLAVLTVPAVIPVSVLAGVRAVSVFLLPLAGALLAAVAAGAELAVGGTLVAWFVGLAVAANATALAVAVHRRRGGRLAVGSPVWTVASVAIVGAAVLWPLTGLRSGQVGYDARAIWVLHAVFIHGGHQTYLGSLRDRVYGFSNPDYPPLVSAAGALAFSVVGHVDDRLAAAVTGWLNAAALGALGCGVASVAGDVTRARDRVVAVGAGAALALAGFGIAGTHAVNGYADLLWAAAATAAVVHGLVLPRSADSLRIAWLCAVVAGLTKNEGMTTVVVIAVLIAFRTVRPGATSAGRRRLRRIAVVAAFAGPGLAWSVLVKAEGIGNTFFNGRGRGTVGFRLRAAVDGVAQHLHLAPWVAAVAVAGTLLMAARRRRLDLANPLWLWGVLVASLAMVVATYTFGRLQIQWWLRTSADRTTIFAQLMLCTELTVWALVALAAPRHAARHAHSPERGRSQAASGPAPVASPVS